MVYPPRALMPEFEITSPDGRKFIVSAPDGASQDEVLAYAQKNTPPADGQRPTGERVARGVGLVGKGVNDAVGAAVGAPFDLANLVLKQPARLLPEAARGYLPDLPPSGFYGQKVAGALNSMGRNDTPESTAERVAYGAGQGVGNAASVFLPAGMVAKGAQAGGMTQGVASRLAAQPGMQAAAGAVGGAVGEATDNPWMGAAASMAVPVGASVARGVISPGGVRPSEETRRLVDVARAEGIPLTPGQATGSRPLRTAESIFQTMPSTAGKAERVADAQRIAFNRAVLARAGEGAADRATPEVLQGALDRAGATIGNIAGRNTMRLTPETLHGVDALARETVRTMPKGEARPLMARVEDFLDKIDTKTFTVDGKAYQQLDSALSKQIRRTMDGNIRESLSNLRDTLRTAMDASIGGDDAAMWQEARSQYANGKLIQKAMNQPSAMTAAGNVPPAGLSSALAQGSASNFAMGRGVLNDVTRVGRAFIQDAVPNSGTPERMLMMNLLTGGMAGGGALAGGVEGAVLGTAGALAGPRAAQAAYMSPLMQHYLTNQVADRIIPRPNASLLGAITAGQARGLLGR